jgi:uncharacterized protein (DUF488 family)
MNTYTIGFTKKNAKTFFNFLNEANISKLIDVRLNNVSQLAGFAKKDDLKFFLNKLCNGAEYVHTPELAPTKEMLSAYKKGEISWERYETDFLNLMAKRDIQNKFKPSFFEASCLLCSEHEPHNCHRKLVVDYLNSHWKIKLEVKHLY